MVDIKAYNAREHEISKLEKTLAGLRGPLAYKDVPGVRHQTGVTVGETIYGADPGHEHTPVVVHYERTTSLFDINAGYLRKTKLFSLEGKLIDAVQHALPGIGDLVQVRFKEKFPRVNYALIFENPGGRKQYEAYTPLLTPFSPESISLPSAVAQTHYISKASIHPEEKKRGEKVYSRDYSYIIVNLTLDLNALRDLSQGKTVRRLVTTKKKSQ